MINILSSVVFNSNKTTEVNSVKDFNININYNKIIKTKNIFYYKNINIDKKNNINFLFVFKPKNQFFCNFFSENLFSYSTGLILRALNNLTRANRRNKLGFSVFFNFLTKKVQNSNFSKKKFVFILKKFNNYNLVKKNFIKIISSSSNVLLKIGKNYSLKKYKKASYINKRMRKKFILE